MYDIFGKYGAIRQIRLGNTTETRGTAYVVYEDIFDAANAVNHLSGFNVAGRYLIVSPTTTYIQTPPPHHDQNPPSSPTAKISSNNPTHPLFSKLTGPLPSTKQTPKEDRYDQEKGRTRTNKGKSPHPCLSHATKRKSREKKENNPLHTLWQYVSLKTSPISEKRTLSVSEANKDETLSQ